MKWLRWEQGRTSPNNYWKMLLLAFPAFADCYILRFPEGSSIDWHTDPISDGFTHHRINFIFWRARKGGQLLKKITVLDGERKGAIQLTLRHKKRLSYMRPDLEPHAFSKVEEGTCLVLSIGWVLRTRTNSPGLR